VSAAALTIGPGERNILHGLLSRRLLILVKNPSGLAKEEGIAVAELYERLGDDLRLMEDIGWPPDADREAVELTMPPGKLGETLKRLRRDACCAPFSMRHEREPEESVDERCRRFRRAVEVCEELLYRLDSSAQDEENPEPISGVSPEDAARHELGAYIPVTDGLVLAAVERAELHEQEEAVLTSVLMAHLGFEWAPPTNRLFFPRLDELRQAGLLTSTEKRGEPFWSLTSVGREQLAKEREAGEVGDLPESPQHRAWRHARVEAALRIEEFKDRVNQLWEETDDLLNRYHPANSAEWFELSARLHHATWRLGSATYCLNEWIEPADERPSVDEAPGPSPGRRAVFAWDQEPKQESGGAA
jgi:DNA-binding PadR family transcriptional regulator